MDCVLRRMVSILMEELILMEEQVDMVVHPSMEEEGIRISLDMEEVDISLNLKLRVMVTAAAVEAMGIGSCRHRA